MKICMNSHIYCNLIPRHLYHPSLSLLSIFLGYFVGVKRPNTTMNFTNPLYHTAGTIKDTSLHFYFSKAVLRAGRGAVWLLRFLKNRASSTIVFSNGRWFKVSPGWSKNCWKAKWLLKRFIKIKKSSRNGYVSAQKHWATRRQHLFFISKLWFP